MRPLLVVSSSGVFFSISRSSCLWTFVPIVVAPLSRAEAPAKRFPAKRFFPEVVYGIVTAWSLSLLLEFLLIPQAASETFLS